MKIKEIYEKYKIHPNLIAHQIRVAKVANFILNNWNGLELDKNKILRLCLIHDLGNIVRMKIEDDYWGKVKSNIVKKYGDEDDLVTIKILKECGVDDGFCDIILAKRFINSLKISKSGDWYLKILLYSDLRVSPFAVTSLKERLNEVISRRKDLSENPEIENLSKANFDIESQIQENVNILLSDINEKTVEIDNEELLHIEI